MAPSSVAHGKIAAVPGPASRKSAVEGFDVMPVGTPCPLPLAEGIITGDGGEICTPRPLYSVDMPDPLSETQIGLVGRIAIPQPFTRLVSVCGATPGTSATRRVTV